MAPIDKNAARAQGKRAARAVVRRVRLDPLATLPNQGGSVGKRAIFAQARLLILDARAFDQGLRLLSRVPESALGATGHGLRAWSHMSLGAIDEAVQEAWATLERNPDAEALGLAMAVATRANHKDLLRRVNDLAESTTPRTTKDAERLLGWYTSRDVAQAEAFIANVDTWRVNHTTHSLDLIRTETQIRAAGDEDAQRATALEVGRTGKAGFRSATRALGKLKGWDELRELYREADLETITVVPNKTSHSLAQRAARAGWLDTAQVISGRLIELGHKKARETHAQVSDQIHIGATGWPVDEAQERSYEPNPRAVLSVLAQSLPHRSGGYATRSHGILTGLQGLGWDMLAATRLGFPYDFWGQGDKREVEPFDVVDTMTYRRLLEPGEREYRTTPMAGYIERFAERLEEVARDHRAGLIHASSFQNNGLAGLRAARRLGIPFVYEMRGLEDLMKISRNPEFGRTDAYRYMTGLELHIVQNADLTFVITEALREEMIRRGGPADRIAVLPNGVHTAQFEPRQPDEALIDELGLRGKTVIGYAGGLVDYEGLDLLLLAAAELKKTRDDFAVIIVGDGHFEGQLHRMARELDVLDVVTFTGRVPHEEVARYLSIFQITPFPRLPLPVCELISPIKPFESMAMGKACISSSVAALTEIVKPDERGLVFEKGSSQDFARQIARYLDDPQLRERMGRQAREWVLAERDWSDVTKIADEAYHRLLG
ncbi:glycosyltransferase family 4 protein [Janibacter sp. CX7]|uniref:glycosyltransferase family 4 protein n=1 Tax=Janibacter sp. CX7 TaxID=2963431 RepID=UPI0020CC9569|nr:glycosyltransferase family 4 protein [Janibacter sp. CX7]UTT66379.1 glycosyltransferase family 4 protein [Janibacter sp. CX7]